MGLAASWCAPSCRASMGWWFFFQAEDGIRDVAVTGVQSCALPIYVGWFGSSSGFLGVVGQRPARPYYQESIAGAEWVGVSNQFFTTLMVPLTAKATGVWGRRFDIDYGPDQKLLGIEGALGMPALEVQPGQTYSAHFEIYAGPKLYHRL